MTLVEYIREFRDLGPERFALKYDHPFLVREEDWEDGTPAFQTQVASKAEVFAKMQTMSPDALDRQSGGGSGVYAVTKRKGGAFADRIGIGRARSVDVCVFLAKVSKYHAYITRTDDGHAITDAGSKNGTKVDDTAVEPKEQRPLSNRAKLQLGPYTFTFFTAEGFRTFLAHRMDRQG